MLGVLLNTERNKVRTFMPRTRFRLKCLIEVIYKDIRRGIDFYCDSELFV